MIKYGKALVLFSLFVMNLVDDPAPEVNIDQGILSGKISRCGTFFEYLGIPYATSDSTTRFQAPGPAPSWRGIYKAVEDHHICPQVTRIGVVGNEDCLKINVYVPFNLDKKPLPIMVYFHGGKFIFGSGSKTVYGPRFLVKKDIIVVTFNYRLASLGFLCLRIKEAPGNAGIKDQIAALRWVKKNIAAFGGDPDNITVFGASAGATCISFLIASESTNGLFNRAIVQSGTSVANWAINRRPIRTASLLAKSIGYDTEDPKELYDIFSRMNYKDLVLLTAEKQLENFYDTGLVHLPCIEKEIPGVESVITDLPYKVLRNIKKDIDVMHGIASNEGLFLAGAESEESLKSRNKLYLFASDLHFSSDKDAMIISEKVRKFYFGDNELSTMTILNVSKLYSELDFDIPAIFETEYLLNRREYNVYNYVFNYHGWRNFLKLTSGFRKEDGATHGDDLFYLFDGDLMPMAFSGDDRRMIEQITTLWTNFAKYGNPTPETSTLPFRWKPSTTGKIHFLYIDKESKMGPMPSPEGYRLWKAIYSKYRNTDIT